MEKEKKEARQYPVEVRWSREDKAFIAEVYDLPGCLADGRTEAAAIAAGYRAAAQWISVARELGREVPPPSSQEPASGKFVVRLPKSLHRELQQRARREGVSLNQLVLTIVAQGSR